ncbi:MAG: type II toxin-antitoxin system HicA family toxin [Thioploca sp.]|nr:type II toxin-antitoxin system HicA family toxin [Thioploca sp.]
MRLPRHLSGQRLVNLLKIFGYQVTRQTGSHIRLTTFKMGKHHMTIPQHNPLRIGTLSAILTDVAQHFQISKEEVIEQLFKDER